MATRGTIGLFSAFLTLALLWLTGSQVGAWDQAYRYPIKVRVSDSDPTGSRSADSRPSDRSSVPEWDVAAGQARGTILCAKRGYTLELGVRPFFSNLSGLTRVVSKGGEGTLLGLNGHLRVPSEQTFWEMYSHLRLYDKVTLRLEYVPWHWIGGGHAGSDGNFNGLLLKKDDPISVDLGITSIVVGADYDVAFGRDLYFGPNADLNIIKWSQRVAKNGVDASDFTQTILQPEIGAHLRYEPTNTGYFSWFKPYMESRFKWMSFRGLSTSGWDVGAGIAPPVSKNVDAGFKLGYKQWKMEGSRGRLFADVGVEGVYLDFSLRF